MATFCVMLFTSWLSIGGRRGNNLIKEACKFRRMVTFWTANSFAVQMPVLEFGIDSGREAYRNNSVVSNCHRVLNKLLHIYV